MSNKVEKLYKKSKKLFRWFSLVFTVVFLVVMYTPVSNWLARTLIVEADAGRADVIAVLGGGVFSNGVLTPASNERLIKGMLLYREGRAPSVIFLGGTIVSPSRKILHTVTASHDWSAITMPESEFMRDVAVGLGLPNGDADFDPLSPNTRENIVNLKAYMEDRGMKTCILVTSATHMLRGSLLAGKAGLDCIYAPVGDYTPYITSPIGRLSLMYTVAWEYAGLVLYRIYGYI